MKGWSILLYVVSLGLVIFGLVTTFHYGDYNADYNTTGSMFGHIVGGDAYNYTIIATRGVVLLIAGLIAALAASALLIVNAIQEAEYRMKSSADGLEYRFRETVRELGTSNT
ncbi:hypothetical protein [Paenibacillus sp. VTT E-133291]|uniref:hypothetical protein n=1 Tax=unclassified Paenibacillus TaxID=185978 RepID=UPI000BA04070|nr:hypothetical protein [Paenibacillus sp. VTT E-133291]OZQ76853.1 hypothetical protein CA598_30235 [Paenibacillus sp. VTT E-133291]